MCHRLQASSMAPPSSSLLTWATTPSRPLLRRSAPSLIPPACSIIPGHHILSPNGLPCFDMQAKNPARDMPIGIVGATTICTILYMWVQQHLPSTACNVPHAP